MLFIGSIVLGLVHNACAPKRVITLSDIEFWAASKKNPGFIVRDQDKKILSCWSQEFTDFVCLTYKDLQKLFLDRDLISGGVND